MLVQDQEFQGRQGSHQQGHRLALAAGEGAHLDVQLILQTQTQSGQLGPVKVHPLFVHALAQAEALALVVRQGEVLQHGQVGAGAQGRVLVHPANGGVPLKIPLLPDALAVHQHVASVQGDAAADDVQQGGLAGAVAPHDGDKLPVRHGQVQAVKELQLRDGAGVVDFGQVFDLKHG